MSISEAETTLPASLAGRWSVSDDTAFVMLIFCKTSWIMSFNLFVPQPIAIQFIRSLVNSGPSDDTV